MSKLARDNRNRDLAKIHMAKKQLGLGDDEYRAILHAQGGASSAGDLDHEGRTKVLAYFKRLGVKDAKPFGQVEKIEWLWRKLGEAGALRDTSNAALLAFVGRTANAGVSHLRFLPIGEASKVIEALKAMLNRRASKQ
jgi:phage gp16-like protein